MYFAYGAKEIEYLKSRDNLLGDAIDLIGPIEREVENDLFSSVIHHIVGQQISTIAQQTIWKRMQASLGEITPATIVGISDDTLQQQGISFRKTEYIKEFAEKVHGGAFDVDGLQYKSDEEIIDALSSLRGIGVWTAEMLLTFCLQRPDVVSFGDLAIHRGMRMLYHHRAITRVLFAKYCRRYSPYGTVASLYLWAIAGGAIPAMKDYAPKKKAAAKKAPSKNKGASP